VGSIVNTAENSAPQEHRSYIVSLEPDEVDKGGDRRARRLGVVKMNALAGQDFRDRLAEAVSRKGLQHDVSYVGEPMSVPFVLVVGTPRLADEMRHMQGVSGVIEDEKTEGLFDIFRPVEDF
jgi:hypothetical protein